MTTNKKSSRIKTPATPAEEPRINSRDDFDNKRKMISEKTRATRVNYIVKDLPIY